MPEWCSARPNGSNRSPRRPPRSPSSRRRRSRDSATARWQTFCGASAGCTSPTIATSATWGCAGSPSRGTTTAAFCCSINGHRVNDNIFGQAEIGRGVRPRSGDVRPCGNHPWARIVTLRRQRVLRRRERHHAVRRVAQRRFDHAGGRHAGDAAGAGQRRAPAGEWRGCRGVGHLCAERWRAPALLSGVRHRGHQQWRGRGARWRRCQATLRPADLQGTGRDRRIRKPATGRAHGLVRHRVQ